MKKVEGKHLYPSKFISQSELNQYLVGNILKTDFEKCIFDECTFDNLRIESDFKNCKFKECKILKCEFTKGTLSQTNFENTTTFINTKFKESDLKNVHFECYVEQITFEKTPFAYLFIKGGGNRIRFIESNGQFLQVSQGIVKGLSFSKNIIMQSSLANTNIQDLIFENTNFASFNINMSFLDRVSFVHAEFTHLSMESVTALNLKIEGSKILNCNVNNLNSPFYLKLFTITGHCFLSGVDLKGYDFSNKDISFSRFSNCDFEGANFQNSILDSVHFNNCDISKADFRYSKVDTNLKFENVDCNDTQIELYQLKKLKSFGGLTESQISEMRIEDGLTDLKTNFTGFLQWLHVISIFAFLAPYIAYLIKLGIKSKFFTNNDSMDPSIFSTFINFLYSGGRMNWEISWTFIAFCTLLVYNVFRGLLLFKTKKMELYQNAIGIPKRFSLDEKVSIFKWKPFTYKWLYNVVKYGVYANLILVLFHVIMFLQRPVHL